MLSMPFDWTLDLFAQIEKKCLQEFTLFLADMLENHMYFK